MRDRGRPVRVRTHKAPVIASRRVRRARVVVVVALLAALAVAATAILGG